uniref:Zf-C2HC5 domain-containing protein n=1 Tax=Heterorhabditis bacteriophora TaxID=37862 RepID=A0A1I7XTX6_HETBA
MARGRVRTNQQQRNAKGQYGGIANQRNHLAAKIDTAIGDQLRPGRHVCRCQARIHSLVRNCMGCGKIVCMQEGSGPCFFCGTLVCTKEEQEVLDRGSRKSVELYNQLMGKAGGSDGSSAVSLSSIGGDLERATVFRNKLLAADADSERQTKVNDLECDYSSVENNPFLTSEEREAIIHRREELKNIREQRKKAVFISLNLSNISVTTEKTNLYDTDPSNDPVIQGILNKSENRRKTADAAHNSADESKWISKEFIPKVE